MKNIDKRYNEIYKRCIELCPDMQDLIEKIRQITPPRTNECKALYERKANGDSKALSRIIEMYLRTALRFSLTAAEKTSLPLDEIFSEAVIGLSESASRYDCRNNSALVNFIISGIRQGIKAYIRRNSSYIPLPAHFADIVQTVKDEKEKCGLQAYYTVSRKISDATGIKLKEVQLALCYTETPMSYEKYCEINQNIAYDGERYIIYHIYWENAKETLKTVMNTLTEREQKVIQLKYGLDLCGQHSVKEIADMFFVDKERIRNIEEKALRKLKRNQKIKELQQLWYF